MNYRLIEIDSALTISPYEFTMLGYGQRTIIRPQIYTHVFYVTLSENRVKRLKKEFEAQFTQRDMDDPKALALLIIDQMKESKSIKIYDCGTHVPVNDDEWTTEIVFSEKAKEVFSELAKHTTRLIDAFSF